MSYMRPVIRAVAVAAIRDKTYAADRVYDSDLKAFGEAVLGQAALPYVVVYTDSDDINGVNGKAELYNGDGRALTVVIEMGIASSIHKTMPDGSPTGPIVINFSQSDQGMELACDILESQVLAALIGDPHSEWGDLFKRLTFKVVKMLRRRGGQNREGVRFAARRVTLVCTMNYDIVPGQRPAANHPVWEFIRLAALQPSSDANDVAQLLTTLLPETGAPDWRIAQSQLGLDTEAARAVTPSGDPIPWPLHETPPLYSPPAEDVPELDTLTTEEDGITYDEEQSP